LAQQRDLTRKRNVQAVQTVGLLSQPDGGVSVEWRAPGMSDLTDVTLWSMSPSGRVRVCVLRSACSCVRAEHQGLQRLVIIRAWNKPGEAKPAQIVECWEAGSLVGTLVTDGKIGKAYSIDVRACLHACSTHALRSSRGFHGGQEPFGSASWSSDESKLLFAAEVWLTSVARPNGVLTCTGNRARRPKWLVPRTRQTAQAVSRLWTSLSTGQSARGSLLALVLWS
jgi:hypothetical protein